MRWRAGRSCYTMHDLILRGGHLIDPAQNIDGAHDIAFAGGKVAAVAPHLEDPAHDVRDMAGLIVAPGLIDLHAHYNLDLVDKGRVEEVVYNGIIFLANLEIGQKD